MLLRSTPPHSHSIVPSQGNPLIQQCKLFRRAAKHRLLDPSKIRALDFKHEFRRSARFARFQWLSVPIGRLLTFTGDGCDLLSGKKHRHLHIMRGGSGGRDSGNFGVERGVHHHALLRTRFVPAADEDGGLAAPIHRNVRDVRGNEQVVASVRDLAMLELIAGPKLYIVPAQQKKC